jgi:hypothetical protein
LENKDLRDRLVRLELMYALEHQLVTRQEFCKLMELADK